MYDIGLVNGSDDLCRESQRALRGLCAVRTVAVDGLTGAVVEASSLQLLLVPLPVPVAEGVAFFARCRRASPGTPLVLLGKAMEIDFVVEFLKCGADDFVSIPFNRMVFRRKIERALGRRVGTAFDIPALAGLPPTEWAHRGNNLRHSYRVTIESTEPVRVTLPLDSSKVLVFDLVDLSVPVGRWPGGMLLALDGDSVDLLPFESWDQEHRLLLGVDLPDGGPPVTVEAYPISTLRRGPAGQVRFNVKYRVKSPSDLARLIRFWSEIQRQRIERSALKAALTGLSDTGPTTDRASTVPSVPQVARSSSWLPAPADPEGGNGSLPAGARRPSLPLLPGCGPAHDARETDPPADVRGSRTPAWAPPPADDEPVGESEPLPDEPDESLEDAVPRATGRKPVTPKSERRS